MYLNFFSLMPKEASTDLCVNDDKSEMEITGESAFQAGNDFAFLTSSYFPCAAYLSGLRLNKGALRIFLRWNDNKYLHDMNFFSFNISMHELAI